MDFRKIVKVQPLLILVLGALVLYIYFFLFIDGSYSPYYGDESFYFKNAESFTKHLSLKAPFTYSGYGSKIWGLDAHGPAYSIIYGGISLVIGWGNLNILFINVCILLISLALLNLRKKETWHEKLLQTLVVLGSPFVFFYSFTFLPELIHVAGAVFLFLAANQYMRKSDKQSFIILILLILGLGFIRSTWFFAFFGLPFLFEKSGSTWKWAFIPLGLCLPFLMQSYLHEQVPNTFSVMGELIRSGNLSAAWESFYFNIKRNIYFALHFTEGKFYTLQKIWIALTLLSSVLLFRRSSVLFFGAITLGSILIFNIVLYKNYDWAELRMYTPMCLFLNLSLISTNRNLAYGLIGLNFISFLLVIPLQQKLLKLRINPSVKDIPTATVLELEQLSSPIVLLDTVLLQSYSLSQLPIIDNKGDRISYILPYYEIETKPYNYFLSIENDHIKVSKAKILTQ
ncbi:hypothetical protein [Algoriphagus aquimarinus]|uniref:Glycosyltransferase RgtA/B/C/D-like domain-containing protein n=1 Tax=Algoriphagus aquimarinus TaxID=237018 RepID=A0A1I1CFT9_9BACT|nr:hypothetical protein [Algoriphagus aquimarinus]SFB61489.1 hypothetical protein SAMN04489723_1355 [Algoriphagus aquimarinus]